MEEIIFVLVDAHFKWLEVVVVSPQLLIAGHSSAQASICSTWTPRSVPTTQHGLAECMSSANCEKCLTYDNSGFPIGGMALVSNQERQNENHDAHTRLRSF